MALQITPRLATLLDQAIVSAAGFLAMLYFAQHLPIIDWAILSFAAGISLVLQGIQINAVTMPMLAFSHGRRIDPAEQQNWTWWHRVVLASLLGLCLLIGILVLQFGSGWVGQSFLYAAVLLPPITTYEYLRRRLILNGNFRALLAASIAYAVGVSLGVLVHFAGSFSLLVAAASFWPGMVLSLLAAGLWDPLRLAAPIKDWFTPLPAFVPSAVASSLAGTGYNFVVLAILGALTGPVAVALFNATRIFIQPIHSLVAALSSLDMPRAATAYTGGGNALLGSQLRAIIRMLVFGTPYLIAICVMAEDILTFTFGDRFKSEPMVWSWSLMGLTVLLATPTEITFYVTRQTGLLFASKLVASAVACGFAYWLIPSLGAVGAVLSISAGWFISFMAGMLTLWSASRHEAALGAAPP